MELTGGGSWIYNDIHITDGSPGKGLSKRLDSYSQADAAFQNKYTPMAKIMNNLISAKLIRKVSDKYVSY